MRNIVVNGIYKHFKGNLYRVLMIALDSDTLEEKVIYQDINNSDKIWVRSLEEFLSEVDKKKYPEAKQRYRFELQD